MTIDEFDSAVRNTKEEGKFPSYPIIAMAFDKALNKFTAWDNNAQWLVCGVFTDKVTPEAIDSAIKLAEEDVLSPEYVSHGLTNLPCVIFPMGDNFRIEPEQLGKHGWDFGFIYGVWTRGDGTLVFEEYVSDDEQAF